jgi:hypothetical protein
MNAKQLRRRIAIYRRSLREIENVHLWEEYSEALSLAEAELKLLIIPKTAAGTSPEKLPPVKGVAERKEAGGTAARKIPLPTRSL